MFGISIAELIVIGVVALLVFGPEKLPEIASQIGKLSFQLKRASDGFRREFYNSVYTPAKEHSDSITGGFKEAKRSLLSLPPDTASENSDSDNCTPSKTEMLKTGNEPHKDPKESTEK